MAQTQTLIQQVQQVQQPVQPAVESPNVPSQQPASEEVAVQEPVPQHSAPEGMKAQEVVPQQPEPVAAEVQDVESPQLAEENFEECWIKMVDAIFQKKPAFYHQLRDYIPRYENDIIYVDVENDFQKNQLEMSKRAMLEFWRDQFKLNVNEMEFVIHEHEKKKVIYTSEDKVENMLEQNPALKDFLQVLNFRIKD